jgi:hypothetical protein
MTIKLRSSKRKGTTLSVSTDNEREGKDLAEILKEVVTFEPVSLNVNGLANALKDRGYYITAASGRTLHLSTTDTPMAHSLS